MLEEKNKTLLLKLAAASVKYGLDHHQPLPINVDEYPDELRQNGAGFVTLQIDNELRGCIGTLEAYQPLVADVVQNAYAAAFRDPRFPALRADEYAQLHYHISVLNPPQPMEFASEADLLAQLRPHIDGLILSDAGRRGTFLPSVWESLPQPRDFLTHLKLKAGLSAGHWSDTIHVQRYTVEDIE
ncbi:MAG: AmmeMemoRadiSam system protein A [Gammaproteobacteria bacterium]|nr:AmmeMemoRadiSam system protein A [Gammaproteobacteria bacterium]MDH5652151.1 AmmeMemoRadiSam system protein A [Gammaproteobacteria bacterium]